MEKLKSSEGFKNKGKQDQDAHDQYAASFDETVVGHDDLAGTIGVKNYQWKVSVDHLMIDSIRGNEANNSSMRTAVTLNPWILT